MSSFATLRSYQFVIRLIGWAIVILGAIATLIFAGSEFGRNRFGLVELIFAVLTIGSASFGFFILADLVGIALAIHDYTDVIQQNSAAEITLQKEILRTLRSIEASGASTGAHQTAAVQPRSPQRAPIRTAVEPTAPHVRAVVTVDRFDLLDRPGGWAYESAAGLRLVMNRGAALQLVARSADSQWFAVHVYEVGQFWIPAAAVDIQDGADVASLPVSNTPAPAGP